MSLYSDDGSKPEAEELFEITSSEAELVCSSDKEDAQCLEVILEGAYTCSPSLYHASALHHAERNSLLLFDKDISDSDQECK